jgi:HlyD family secretion protein
MADAEVKAAQAQQLHASANRDNQAAILEAEAALAQAQYNQQQIQTALDQLYGYDRANGSRANDLRLQLQSVIADTQAAQARLNALKSGSPSDRVSSAQITAASATEKAAQARLDQLKAEAAGKAADPYQAAIQQAEAALLSARQTSSETEIRAPFAGTIAKIKIQLGEQATVGTPAIVLADLSGWQIETKDLTEIKVPAVEVGQSVTIKFDALPNVELKGTVKSIGAMSQLNSGDVVYPAKIDLLDTDPRLRWGMTAELQFGP